MSLRSGMVLVLVGLVASTGSFAKGNRTVLVDVQMTPAGNVKGVVAESDLPEPGKNQKMEGATVLMLTGQVKGSVPDPGTCKPCAGCLVIEGEQKWWDVSPDGFQLRQRDPIQPPSLTVTCCGQADCPPKAAAEADSDSAD